MKKWLDTEESLEYLGLSSLSYFKNLLRTGRGPRFFRPSPRKKLFSITDLDDWRATWQRSA